MFVEIPRFQLCTHSILKFSRYINYGIDSSDYHHIVIDHFHTETFTIDCESGTTFNYSYFTCIVKVNHPYRFQIA